MARRKRKAPSAHPLLDHARARGHGPERHQPLHRAGVGADGAPPRRTRVAEALDTAPGVRVCAVCSRAARGFYYTHQLRPDRYPTFAFCSHRCQCAGAAIAKRKNGMIDKTDMETRAIKDARRLLAEVLTELGLLASFHDRPAADIDRIIEACVDGFQDSMQRQSLNGDIPF